MLYHRLNLQILIMGCLAISTGCTTIKDWVEKYNYTYIPDASTFNPIGKVPGKDFTFKKNVHFGLEEVKTASLPQEIVKSATKLEFGTAISKNKIIKDLAFDVKGSFELSNETKITFTNPQKHYFENFIPRNPCNPKGAPFEVVVETLDSGDFCEAKITTAGGTFSIADMLSGFVLPGGNSGTSSKVAGAVPDINCQEGRASTTHSATPAQGMFGIGFGTSTQSRTYGNNIILGYKSQKISCKPSDVGVVRRHGTLTDTVEAANLGVRIRIAHRWRDGPAGNIDFALLHVYVGPVFFPNTTTTERNLRELKMLNEYKLGAIKRWRSAQESLMRETQHSELKKDDPSLRVRLAGYADTIRSSTAVIDEAEKKLKVERNELLAARQNAPNCKVNPLARPCKIEVNDYFGVPGTGNDGILIQTFDNGGEIYFLFSRYRYTYLD